MSTKIVYEPKTRNITVEIEASDDRTAFKELGHAQELYGHTKCGRKDCGSNMLRYIGRKTKPNAKGKTFEYFEILCLKCKHKFCFGVSEQDGVHILFPKWDQGEDGWIKHVKGGTEEED